MGHPWESNDESSEKGPQKRQKKRHVKQGSPTRSRLRLPQARRHALPTPLQRSRWHKRRLRGQKAPKRPRGLLQTLEPLPRTTTSGPCRSPVLATTYCSIHDCGSAAFLTFIGGLPTRGSHIVVAGDWRHFGLRLDTHSLLHSHLTFSDLLSHYLSQCFID
jgi:hypothetical protein